MVRPLDLYTTTTVNLISEKSYFPLSSAKIDYIELSFQLS
jgi:hypothetical protein